jgi:hypothetical protein
MRDKHPSEMSEEELTAINYFDRFGAHWLVIRSTGQEHWSRVYAGYDLDRRTEPYIMGPGLNGKRRG